MNLRLRDTKDHEVDQLSGDFRVLFGKMPGEAPFFVDDWAQLLGKSKNAIYLMVNRGLLPRRIELGQVGLTWRVESVRAWLSALPEAGSDGNVPRQQKQRGRPRYPVLDLAGHKVDAEKVVKR